VGRRNVRRGKRGQEPQVGAGKRDDYEIIKNSRNALKNK
jgi:hypothetical protein